MIYYREKFVNCCSHVCRAISLNAVLFDVPLGRVVWLLGTSVFSKEVPTSPSCKHSDAS